MNALSSIPIPHPHPHPHQQPQPQPQPQHHPLSRERRVHLIQKAHRHKLIASSQTRDLLLQPLSLSSTERLQKGLFGESVRTCDDECPQPKETERDSSHENTFPVPLVHSSTHIDDPLADGLPAAPFHTEASVPDSNTSNESESVDTTKVETWLASQLSSLGELDSAHEMFAPSPEDAQDLSRVEYSLQARLLRVSEEISAQLFSAQQNTDTLEILLTRLASWMQCQDVSSSSLSKAISPTLQESLVYTENQHLRKELVHSQRRIALLEAECRALTTTMSLRAEENMQLVRELQHSLDRTIHDAAIRERDLLEERVIITNELRSVIANLVVESDRRNQTNS